MGGSNALVGLSVKNLALPGCFILRHVVPKQSVHGFGDHLDGARVLQERIYEHAYDAPTSHVIAVVPPIGSEPTEDAPVLTHPRLLPVPAKKSCKSFALSRNRQRRTNKVLSRKPKQLQLNKPERRSWTSSSNG